MDYEKAQIVPWSKGEGTILFPLLSLSSVDLLSFVLVALDLTVWHGRLTRQVVVVVTHFPLMHVVKVELDSICAVASTLNF
jgi:hypothetical protein